MMVRMCLNGQLRLSVVLGSPEVIVHITIRHFIKFDHVQLLGIINKTRSEANDSIPMIEFEHLERLHHSRAQPSMTGHICLCAGGNTHLDGTEVAGTARMIIANLNRHGNRRC